MNNFCEVAQILAFFSFLRGVGIFELMFLSHFWTNQRHFWVHWNFSIRLNYCTIFSKQEIITFKSNPVLSNSSDLPSVTRTEDLNSNIGRLQQHNDTAHSPNHPQYVGLVIISALSEQTTWTLV